MCRSIFHFRACRNGRELATIISQEQWQNQSRLLMAGECFWGLVLRWVRQTAPLTETKADGYQQSHTWTHKQGVRVCKVTQFAQLVHSEEGAQIHCRLSRSGRSEYIYIWTILWTQICQQLKQIPKQNKHKSHEAIWLREKHIQLSTSSFSKQTRKFVMVLVDKFWIICQSYPPPVFICS